jgi:hypothetical protein
MKKLKFLFILLLTFSLTGCLSVSLDVTLKNDDSGSIKYIVACQKELCESMTEESPMIEEEDFNGIKDATTKDITFKKGDVEYQGKEVNVPFKSLQELNEIMKRVGADEEDTEETTDQFMSAKREGSKVSLTMPGNPDSYEEMASTIPLIDYSTTIKIEGKVLSQNADDYSEKEKTLTWNITTILKDGIKLEYETKAGLFTPLNMIIGVVALIVIAAIIGLLATRKKKEIVITNSSTPVELVTPTMETVVQDEVIPTTPTIESTISEVVESTTDEPSEDQINQ